MKRLGYHLKDCDKVKTCCLILLLLFSILHSLKIFELFFHLTICLRDFVCCQIFIPIHMNIHWTLAVINIKDRKFQYLDSFKGREPKILNALVIVEEVKNQFYCGDSDPDSCSFSYCQARYFVDEVKDKSEIDDIDLSWWKREYVQDLPGQKNGYVFTNKMSKLMSANILSSYTHTNVTLFSLPLRFADSIVECLC